MSHDTRCSRRAFLGSTMMGAAIVACGGSEDLVVPPLDDGVTVSDDEIRIALARTPALDRRDGSLVVYQANVIVIRAPSNDYRAFTNICTHAGCGISIYLEGAIRCQCHGSEFDVLGARVAGPAIHPLARYPVVHDAAARVLYIARRPASV